MALSGSGTSGFLKLAPLARSASPRYGVLKGIGSTSSSIPKPKGMKVPKPGAAMRGAPNLSSPFGKTPSLGKVKL